MSTYTAHVTPVFEPGTSYRDGVDRGRIEISIHCGGNWHSTTELRRKLRAGLKETSRYGVDGELICTVYGTIASAASWGRFLRAAGRAGVDLDYRTGAGTMDAVLAVMPDRS